MGLFGVNDVTRSDPARRFGRIAAYLREFDYVVGNLELPLTTADRRVRGKSAHLKASPDNVETLRQLGVTHVCLANNHLYDYGRRGVADTLACLDRQGIAYFGIHGKSAYLEKDGVRVALHGYCCYTTNPIGVQTADGKAGIHALSPARVQADLAADAQAGYRSAICFHWGDEHVHYPRPEHIRLARELAGRQPCLIVGHHPHVVQGIEAWADSWIAYSLGNFCFDDVYTPKSDQPLVALTPDNRHSMIWDVTWDDAGIRQQATGIVFDGQTVEFDDPTAFAAALDTWSAALAAGESPAYRQRREQLLAERLAARRQQRDFHWYWTRLRLDSAIQILRARRNRRRYAQEVLRYLDDAGAR